VGVCNYDVREVFFVLAYVVLYVLCCVVHKTI
jgi:hypothetical protein